MKIYSQITTIFLILLSYCDNIYSQTAYLTYLNKFGELKNSENTINDNVLCDRNMSFDDIVNITVVNTSKATFDSYIRFRNLNNKEGKKYKVCGVNGETRKISNPYWGYVWNYQNKQNYYAVTLKGYSTASHDILDSRLLQVDVFRMCDGKKDFLKTLRLDDGVDVYDGNNVIRIKYDGNITSVYLGKKELKCIDNIQGVEYCDSMGIGYIMGSGSELQIERLVYKKNKIKELELMTEWNKHKIDSCLKNKTNYIEGLWIYLDRNIDDENIKLGGKYTLAVVKNDVGDYDILYYDGSVVNSSKWKCGMLKGRLKRTKFQNNFDLIWYDSTMKEMSDDSYAVFESGTILTLYFPVEKSQIRFVKQ